MTKMIMKVLPYIESNFTKSNDLFFKGTWILFLGFLILLSSCKEGSNYERLLEEGAKAKEEQNDLFLGLHLGMKKKAFFEECWELNRQGILNNGPSPLMVVYRLNMPSKKEAKMSFYPKFENDEIYMMPISFNYIGWFPTNPEFANDKLLEDVKEYLESLYGTGFMDFYNDQGDWVKSVKVDANRHIRIFERNIKTIGVEIQNLKVKAIQP